jgi:hypothetical protein
MMGPWLGLGAACVSALSAPSQQALWSVHSVSGIRYTNSAPWFGDLNHDGYDDLLASALDYAFPWTPRIVRVLSGRDGVVLGEVAVSGDLSQMVGVGDYDGDGNSDFAYTYGSVVFQATEVWSVSPPHLILQIPGNTPGSIGGQLAGNLDCDGDGRPDLIVMHGNGRIHVYDHVGTLRYTIPAGQWGFPVRGITGVGDLDGDGADEFLCGASEAITIDYRGVAVVISGRTGAVLRMHWGPQPYDILNSDVMRTGDIDGDGVGDYACGNWGGFSGLVMAWSGATGVLIREWRDQVGLLSGKFLVGDVDLDGRPDILNMAPAHPGQPWNGRIRTLSSRDGQDLVHVVPTQQVSDFGRGFADLGVQPGNPYPVFAQMDIPFVAPWNGWPRIRAIRCSPVGTQFVGQGCSTSPQVPTIGLRRVDPLQTSAPDRSRIVLGSAPENALALCIVAPVASTIGGGFTVPAALDPFGLSGCTLLVPPVLTAARLTGNAGMDRGYAAVDLMATLVPAGGAPYAAQWIVLDPVTLAHAATARFEFRVQ